MTSSTGRRVGVTAACAAVRTGGLTTAAAAAPLPAPHAGASAAGRVSTSVPGPPVVSAAARAAFARTHPADARLDRHATASMKARRITRFTATTDPIAVDLSANDMPVGYQGRVGSCVSWAVTYAQMGWYAHQAGQSIAFAPMYAYSQVHADTSALGGGSTPFDNYNVAIDQGIDI